MDTRGLLIIKLFLILIVMCFFSTKLEAKTQNPHIRFNKDSSVFELKGNNKTLQLFVDSSDYEGVPIVAQWLINDLLKVCGQKSALNITNNFDDKQIIIAGTIGKNKLIDRLIKERKIDVADLKGQWERSLTQVVENPFPGVDKALVFAGSDKRGTFYAMLNFSRDIGVSPWYWWADVPVNKHETVGVSRGRYITKSPKVKYRGIFLNDEEPALGSWVRENFDGFNAKFYTHVFQLILRQRGNFLWPAMWGKAFFDDDPENGILANKLGIVMSTSHHEPMGKAQQEWHRYGSGKWNYKENDKVLKDFWTKGMERNKDYETIVTVGMRGDGDEAMEEGTNITLLEKIVKDQRKIIRKVTGKDAEKTPQVWALYKEVQEYYDKGMSVPEDITLLLCDDNWGNVRKLPDLNAKARSGGYGMYYHLDYVGGPRCYKWINVSQIQRVWEQMNLTYSHGVDRIWVVNVGDLKPMEYPISFFMDMAWDPTQFNSQNLYQHTLDWCAEQFGEEYASEAARIINLYSKYNHRITPELLNESTFSLDNYDEFKVVTDNYKDLTLDALRLYNFIPNKYKDAFDQLVLFPTNATCNLYEMYYALAKNKQLAAENNTEANYWAKEVKRCFERDSVFTVHYNKQISGGKWNHQMSQVRIGYTSWNGPKKSIMPEISLVEENQLSNQELLFKEANGYVSIEAANFQKSVGTDKIKWNEISDLGKTCSAVTTFPQNEYPAVNDSIYIEYAIDFETKGMIDVQVMVSPTLTFNANKGLRYAISIDGGEEQIVNINKAFSRDQMEHWQAVRINKTTTKHELKRTGIHIVRIRVLEPGIVFQKILIDTGGLLPSYLGPEQSDLVQF